MEVVQRSMEIMMGEIDQIRRSHVFDQKYCEKLMMRRNQFEYKINSASKSCKKQDFLDYIEHEKTLLEVFHLRRSGHPLGDQLGDIERKIIDRIKKLFQMSLQHFRDDTALWLAFFQFCKQVHDFNGAQRALADMIKNHSDNDQMWQVAGQWHAYDRKNITTGLEILCKGLMQHKDSKLLYMELIRLEMHSGLANNWPMKEIKSELTDQQKVWLKKLCRYINEIFENIKDCDYYVEVLEYLSQFNFTISAQDIIVKRIVDCYYTRALTWHMLAQRDLKGLSTPMEIETPSSSTNKLAKCIARYKEGLGRVALNEKELLWSLYLNCIIDSRREHPGSMVGSKTASLKEALQQAFDEGYLSEKYYIHWLELVSGDEQIEVLQNGIESVPQSVELWKRYLKAQIMKDDPKEVLRTFHRGVDALRDKALPLWTAVIRYCCLIVPDELDKLYEEGVRQPREVSDFLKPQYLEYLLLTKGMKFTRRRYRELAKKEPYCKELHVTMAKLESTELFFNFESMREIHELACKQFGNEDIEVWVNRIRFFCELSRPELKKTTLENIYLQAQEALPTLLFLDFEEKYYAMTAKKYSRCFSN